MLQRSSQLGMQSVTSLRSHQSHPDLSGLCFLLEPGYCLDPNCCQGPCLVPWPCCSYGLYWCLWPLSPQGVTGIMMMKSDGHAGSHPPFSGPGITGPASRWTLQEEGCTTHTVTHTRERLPYPRWGRTNSDGRHLAELALTFIWGVLLRSPDWVAQLPLGPLVGSWSSWRN